MESWWLWGLVGIALVALFYTRRSAKEYTEQAPPPAQQVKMASQPRAPRRDFVQAGAARGCALASHARG